MLRAAARCPAGTIPIAYAHLRILVRIPHLPRLLPRRNSSFSFSGTRHFAPYWLPLHCPLRPRVLRLPALRCRHYAWRACWRLSGACVRTVLRTFPRTFTVRCPRTAFAAPVHVRATTPGLILGGLHSPSRTACAPACLLAPLRSRALFAHLPFPRLRISGLSSATLLYLIAFCAPVGTYTLTGGALKEKARWQREGGGGGRYTLAAPHPRWRTFPFVRRPPARRLLGSSRPALWLCRHSCDNSGDSGDGYWLRDASRSPVAVEAWRWRKPVYSGVHLYPPFRQNNARTPFVQEGLTCLRFALLCDAGSSAYRYRKIACAHHSRSSNICSSATNTHTR